MLTVFGYSILLLKQTHPGPLGHRHYLSRGDYTPAASQPPPLSLMRGIYGSLLRIEHQALYVFQESPLERGTSSIVKMEEAGGERDWQIF